MCGRFDIHLPIKFLANYFGVPVLQDLHPHFNIAPTQQVLVVRTTQLTAACIPEGQKHLTWPTRPSYCIREEISPRNQLLIFLHDKSSTSYGMNETPTGFSIKFLSEITDIHIDHVGELIIHTFPYSICDHSSSNYLVWMTQ